MAEEIKSEPPAELPKDLTIHQRMVAVARMVDPIGKNKEGAGISYKFRGIDDFYNALQPLLAAAGIYVRPKVIHYDVKTEKRESVTEYNGQQKTKIQYVTTSIILMEYTFVGENGDETACTMLGESTDYSDKASNQAMSNAMKYALTQVFTIPTGETPDGDGKNPEKAGESKTSGGKRLPYFKCGDAKDEGLKWLDDKQVEVALEKIGNGEGASLMPYFLKYRMSKERREKIKAALVAAEVCAD